MLIFMSTFVFRLVVLYAFILAGCMGLNDLLLPQMLTWTVALMHVLSFLQNLTEPLTILI